MGIRVVLFKSKAEDFAFTEEQAGGEVLINNLEMVNARTGGQAAHDAAVEFARREERISGKPVELLELNCDLTDKVRRERGV